MSSSCAALSSAPTPPSALKAIFWRGKATVTFSDMITCIRRAVWKQWCLHTQADLQEVSRRSQALQDTIPYTLAPGA